MANIVLEQLDQQIAKLQTARDAVAAALGEGAGSNGAVKRGRPYVKSAPFKGSRPNRVMSHEARARIAEAQKKRWAQVNKDKQAEATHKRGPNRPRGKKENSVPVEVVAEGGETTQ